MERCKVHDRLCTQCGECDYCPYEENKICDNCFKCLEPGSEFAEIIIDDIIVDE